MITFTAGRRWLGVLGVCCVLQAVGWAQVIRLPGGITIGDSRQQNRPGVPDGRYERPNADRVCPQTVDWIGILQKEYPGVDLGRIPASRVQTMAVPLFSDDAFKREFGVSYPQMSDAERRDFFRMHVIPCTTSRQYAQQVMVLQVFNTPFMPGASGMGPLAPGQLIPALSRLATARTTLLADEQSLTATPPSPETYDRALALSAQRKDELARVWPSEKARFEIVVKDAVGRSASVAVAAKIQPLLGAAASPETARQLGEAPQTYRTLFAAMPPDQQSQMRQKLDDRRLAVLRELLPAEQAKASAFPATRQGLDDGSVWFGSFQTVFLQSPAPPEADAIAKTYLAHREGVLARMAPAFRQKIETTQDPDTLATLYDDVFRLPEDRQTATWQELSTLRTSRAKLLSERAEQARHAAEEREERAALARGDIVASSLKTANLQNASVFRALYTGDAAASGLSRSNILFTKIFETYLIYFGQTCSDALPPNRVQMTYQECAYNIPVTNYNGWYFNTTTECGRWETRNYQPPAFADPRSYAAEESAGKLAQISFVQDTLKKVFTDPLSPFSMLGDMVVSKATLDQDVPELIEQNGCRSKALARLQDNMTRLARGQDPLRLAGYKPDLTHTTAANQLDVRGLVDDLIRADAAGWLLNRYGGLNSAAIAGDPDAQGRPRRIHATYSQEGFSKEGSADIAFSEGVPSCLYFADAPTSCKTPSRAVIKRYQEGAYNRASR